MKDVTERTARFNTAWRAIDTIYSDYAKSIGISYSELHILCLIAVLENCTQKILCEKIFLPKQTVNSIVTSLYKNGLIELREVPEDRRAKTIHFTKTGEQFAKKYIDPITEAERSAMASLAEEDGDVLVQSMETYAKVFRRTLIK